MEDAHVRGRWAIVWVLALAAIAVAGLYFGYVHPEVTAIVVLLALVGVWVFAERLTGKWWY